MMLASFASGYLVDATRIDAALESEALRAD